MMREMNKGSKKPKGRAGRGKKKNAGGGDMEDMMM